MKSRLIGLGLLATILIIGATTAFAATLGYPYFPIPSTQSCSSTAQPQYCVVPAQGQTYFANETGFLNDSTRWAYAWDYSNWDDPNNLMSMCIGEYESAGGTYQLHDNGGSQDWRFDYGYLSINSQHGYDPYYLVTSAPYNIGAGYNIWDSAGDSWTPWSVYNAGWCDGNGAVWQYVSSPTCSYYPSAGSWGNWDDEWVWVWWLGYPGDDSNYIAGMFC